jgi:hypothetical protein
LAFKIPLFIHPVTEKQAVIASTSLSLMILLGKGAGVMVQAIKSRVSGIDPVIPFPLKKDFEENK